MAVPSWALIQSGAFNGVSQVDVQSGQVQTDVNTRNVTSSVTSGTNTTIQVGRYFYRVSAEGFYVVNGSYPLPIGQAASNSPVTQLDQAQLVRTQEVRNNSGPLTANGTAVFSKGVQTFFGNANAWLKQSEAPLENGTIEVSNLTIPISDTASVVGDAILREFIYNWRFKRGGSVPARFSFLMTGQVSLNGTTPFSDTEFTASLNAANGNTWSGTVILERITSRMDYRGAGATQVSVKGPFQDAVSFS